MPIYEYKCKKCETCFEKLVLTRDEDPVVCPECGAKQTDKLMSCASLMGSGIGNACASNSGSGFS